MESFILDFIKYVIVLLRNIDETNNDVLQADKSAPWYISRRGADQNTQGVRYREEGMFDSPAVIPNSCLPCGMNVDSRCYD